MAFNVSEEQVSKTGGKVELVINMPGATHIYALPRLKKSEMVQLSSRMKGEEGDAYRAQMIDIVVGRAEVKEGGVSLYDLMDSVNTDTYTELSRYIFKLATASTLDLSNEGVKLL